LASFFVPGEPLPKERPRVVRGKNGRPITFTPRRTALYEENVRAAAKLAFPKPMTGPVGVEIIFYRSTRRRVDIDNLAKSCLDAIQGVVLNDDAQVVQLYLTKCLASKVLGEKPGCSISVWESAQ
jgi:Holliday junction resolvase RusA-like endonuclease